MEMISSTTDRLTRIIWMFIKTKSTEKLEMMKAMPVVKENVAYHERNQKTGTGRQMFPKQICSQASIYLTKN